jgi:hypothetical protein
MLGKVFYQADDGSGGGGGSPEPTGITLEVDGEQKVFTPEQVLDMHKNLAKATQNSQAAAPLLKLAEQTGMAPEDLSQQVGGMFSLVQDLIDQGLIDAEGNVIKKQEAVLPKGKQPPADDDADPNAPITKAQLMELLTGTLEEKLSPFQKAIQDLGQMNTGLQRAEISRRLKDEYKDADLSDEDVTAIIANSRAGKLKLRQAADQFIAKRNDQMTRMEQQIKEKLKAAGLDLDSFDLNSLKEQDADSVAARITADKKLSFKKGKGSLTPSQAAKDYLDTVL